MEGELAEKAGTKNLKIVKSSEKKWQLFYQTPRETQPVFGTPLMWDSSFEVVKSKWNPSDPNRPNVLFEFSS